MVAVSEANETAAVATLREIARAQEIFRLAALVDEDGDGHGEYALLGDLARLHAGVPAASLPHGDLAPSVGKIACAGKPALLDLAVEALCTLRRDIDLNLDPGAALERAALVLAAREPAQLLC